MSDEDFIASKCRRLLELRDVRDETKAAADESEEEYRNCEAELYEEWEDSPLKGRRRIDLGEPYGTVAFTPTKTVFGRILDADKALEYFENHGLTGSMTKPSIAKARLNELAKERVEQGQPMPDGVDWYANRRITITRPKNSGGVSSGGLDV